MTDQAKPTTIEIHDPAFDLVATIKNSNGIAAALERLGAAVLGRIQSATVPSPICRCDEVSTEQLEEEHERRVNEAEHLRLELEKRGVFYLDLEADFSAMKRLLDHLGVTDEASVTWLSEARKRIDAELAAKDTPAAIPADHQHDIALALEFVHENLVATPTAWLDDTAQRVKREIDRRMASRPIQTDPSTPAGG